MHFSLCFSSFFPFFSLSKPKDFLCFSVKFLFLPLWFSSGCCLVERMQGSSSEKEGGGTNKKAESGMEVQVSEADNMEFWPLQHPLEPDHQDRPVICPIPNSTSLVHLGTVHNGNRTLESWRKRTEMSREVKATAETVVRPVRKRHHHTLSQPDHLMAGMSRRPTTQNFTIFQMLQQLENFES